MAHPNYDHTITVKATPHEAFLAITTGIPTWWTTDINGNGAAVGDAFTVRFGGTRKVMRVVELVPDKKVTWRCEEGYIDMETLQNKNEWVGTLIHWHIQEEAGVTGIRLLHEGLTQQFECYDVCAQGWNHFLASLQQLLNTKQGAPFVPQPA